MANRAVLRAFDLWHTHFSSSVRAGKRVSAILPEPALPRPRPLDEVGHALRDALLFLARLSHLVQHLSARPADARPLQSDATALALRRREPAHLLARAVRQLVARATGHLLRAHRLLDPLSAHRLLCALAYRREVFALRAAGDHQHLLRSQWTAVLVAAAARSEEHTSELQSRQYLVCRLLLEK